MTEAIIYDPLLHLAASPTIILGVGAAILSIFAFFPYARDTFLGHTQPQRACWLIWSVLSVISLLSQIAEGAGSSLWFGAIQCGGTVTILLLSITRGSGGWLRRGDAWILAGAAVGLGLWALTDTPAYALGISILISMLGGVATIRKAYREPESETMITWVICLFASVMAIGSVGTVDWILLAYPLYLFSLYAAIVTAITFSPKRIAATRAAAIPFQTKRRATLRT